MLDVPPRQVQARLDKHQHYEHTLTLKIKYADYQQITRSRTVGDRLQHLSTIAHMAQELLMTHVGDRKKVRLLGISISNLKPRTSPLDQADTYLQLCLELNILE
ncbi:MAG: hypothetical protein ACFE0I_19625 [Elainellaceae cyanobacterium]